MRMHFGRAVCLSAERKSRSWRGDWVAKLGLGRVENGMVAGACFWALGCVVVRAQIDSTFASGAGLLGSVFTSLDLMFLGLVWEGNLTGPKSGATPLLCCFARLVMPGWWTRSGGLLAMVNWMGLVW